MPVPATIAGKPQPAPNSSIILLDISLPLALPHLAATHCDSKIEAGQTLRPATGWGVEEEIKQKGQ